ncbi:MAG: penicillin-binding protein 2 [Thermomicrobiales bacterium]
MVVYPHTLSTSFYPRRISRAATLEGPVDLARYHSPYSAPNRAARWPWVVAALLLLLLAAAATVAIRGGLFTSTNVQQEAAQLPTPTSDALAIVAETVPPSETAVAVAATATAAPPTGAAPTVPPTPAASPTPAGPSPSDIAQLWADRWGTGDYDGMYDLLSADAQTAIAREDFISRYEDISAEAGLTDVTMKISGEPNLESSVPVEVTLESSLVGPITEENSIPLTKDDDGWKVAWSPSLIFANLGGDGCVQFDPEPAERGAILTRNGDVLAVDGEVYQVSIVPGDIEDEPGMLSELSDLLDMPEEDIEAAYADARPEWNVPIKLVSSERGNELLDPIGSLAGVRMVPTLRRVYPQGSLTAHITGYVSQASAEDIDADPAVSEGDWVGRAGLEAGANDLLTGTPGGRLAVVECESRSERVEIASRNPKPARDLVLTLDLDLQKAVDKAVGDVEGDEQGSAVVLDPRNGAVLAMVSHPSYDPNDFILGFSEKEWNRVNDEKTTPLINRVTDSSYPTGSIFKMITTAAAMEYLDYTADTVIDCPSQFFLEGNVYNDWVIEYESPPQGPLTLHQALVQSCNTVFYQLGQALDDEDEMALPTMTRAFGLGAPTGIPYFPETSGIVPDPEWKIDVIGDGWSNGDAINMAIGQGFLQATPLQMANAYATLANGGTLYQPYIVDRLRQVGGSTEQIGAPEKLGELPLSSTQIEQIQSALREQTSNTYEAGSARVFGPNYDYPIAGKTGTAQVARTQDSKPHSWFAAFGPYGETPTITTIVMIENIGEGGKYAAPATKAIFDAYRQMDLAAETGP